MAKVADVLREKGAKVLTTDPSRTVYDAIEKMSAQNVGALVVVEGGEVCGIITERDYLRQIALKGRSSRTTPVRDIMTTEVTCVDPTAAVDECLALMSERHFRHLPVLEKGRLIGIVSVGDLIKQIVREQSIHIEHLTAYIAGKYPR